MKNGKSKGFQKRPGQGGGFGASRGPSKGPKKGGFGGRPERGGARRDDRQDKRHEPEGFTGKPRGKAADAGKSRDSKPFRDSPRRDDKKPFREARGDAPRRDTRTDRSEKPQGRPAFKDAPRNSRDGKPAGRTTFKETRVEKTAFEKPRFEKPRFEKAPFEKTGRAHSGAPRLTGTLLWGFHAIRSAWLNPKRNIQRLLATDTALAAFQDTIDQPAVRSRPTPEIIDKGALDRMMPAGSVHQGLVAIVDNLEARDAHDLIASLGPDDAATILILDQVTDPHNVGAILRSAAAFGAQGVILQERHAPDMEGVLAKTASGAADVIPVAFETNLSRAIELLQENGFYVAGLDEEGVPIAAFKKHKRTAIVLGAEGSGIRRLVAEHCDGLISLPTVGTIRSLNVSNAAAVALYAITQK